MDYGSTPPRWLPAIASQALDDRNMLAANAGGHPLVILRADGEVVAYRDACPHEGYPLSTHGERQDFVIVCNKHLWEFEAGNGEHISRIPRPQCNLKRYPVRLVDGMVQVDVSGVPLMPPTGSSGA